MTNSPHNSNNSLPFRLLIQTNSPGELISWVTPVVQTFKAKCPNSIVSIFLVPCQYASGREYAIASGIEGVDEVFTPRESVSSLVFSRYAHRKSPGAILYLGGDITYTRLLKWRTGYDAYGYTEHDGFSSGVFKHLFYKSKDGDLMAARSRQFTPKRHATLEKYGLKNQRYCLIFCGSRPTHFKALFPFMLDVLARVQESHSDFVPLILVSPFISDQDLNAYKPYFQSHRCHVLRGDSLELMSISSLLVSLPGTNTAEAMYRGLPMLVLMPLNRPDLIILDGLAGLIGSIPLLGIWIKKIVLRVLAKRIKFVALPNRLAGKEIVPEIRGTITEEQVSSEIESLFYDEKALSKQIKALQSLTSSPKVDEKIVDALLANYSNI